MDRFDVAVLSFGSKDNSIMKAVVLAIADETYIQIEVSFRYTERTSNSVLEIALLRIGNPKYLSFVYYSLILIYYISHFSGAMDILAPALVIYLDIFLILYVTLDRIQDDKFPLPEKNDIYPFPEDYIIQGLLYTEKLYPEKWFLSEKTDKEEKYHELLSMIERYREHICGLLAIRFDSSKPKFLVDGKDIDLETLKSRSTTFASTTTTDTTLPRAETWSTIGTNSDAEKDISPATITTGDTPLHD
ncbi:telomerase-binding EST1A protein [Rutstroemia sp. NJR-2017a BVV2]|nr:telomerase-binding EST1A protein [Rutstroemia sp. NJR-2017a BVV2]